MVRASTKVRNLVERELDRKCKEVNTQDPYHQGVYFCEIDGEYVIIEGRSSDALNIQELIREL